MRLIDADALTERFNKIAEGKIERIVGMNCESLTDEMSKIVKIAIENGEMQSFKDFIDNQPTAYDIDKVVEQLEELSKYEVVEKKFEKAIEIVKKGGVADET